MKNYIKNIILFCGIFLCIVTKSSADEIILQEFHDFTFAIVQMEINDVNIDEYVDSYDTIYGHFFALDQLTSILGFDISYDLFSPNAKGWIYSRDNIFTYDSDNYLFTVGKNTYKVDQSRIVYRDNEIFLTIDEFVKVFGMRYVYQGDKLLLKLFSSKVTPVEQRYLLQNKYKRLGDKNKRAPGVVQDPDIEFGYELISAPILEFNLDMNYDYAQSTEDGSSYENNNGLSGTVETYVSNNLLYMDSSFYVHYDKDQGIDSKLFTLKRFEQDRSLLGFMQASRIEVGDVNSQVGQGIGFAMTNSANEVSSNFDEVRVTGVGFAGWRVELYVNNILIDIKTIDSDGQYEFDDVKLKYNSNYIELIKYGDHGEVEKEIRRYNLGGNLLKDNKLFYQVEVVKGNEYLFYTDNSFAAENKATNYYVKLGKKINDRNSVFYEKSLESEVEDSNRITLANSRGGAANFFSYSQDSETDTNLFESRTLFEIQEKNIKTEISYQFEQKPEGDNHSIDGNIARKYERFNYEMDAGLGYNYFAETGANIFEYNYSVDTGYNFDNCFRLYNGLDYAYASEDTTISTSVTARCYLTKQWISATVDYDILPETDIDSVYLAYNLNINDDLTYQSNINLDNSEGLEWSLENELLRNFYDIFDAGLFLDYYDQDNETVFGLTFNANGQFMIGYNPYAASKTSLIINSVGNRAILGIRSFIDENYNDYFDEGDTLLNDMRYKGLNETKQSGSSRAIAYYTNLGKSSNYYVSPDYNSLENVDLTSPRESVIVKVITSKISYIDYFFVYYGFADGKLFLENTPIKRTKLTLIKSDGTELDSYITEDDGYFYFQNLPVGEYMLEVSNTSYEKLEMTEPLNFPIIITKDDLFREELTPNLANKVSDKVREFFIPSKIVVAEVEPEPEIIEEPINISVFEIDPKPKKITKAKVKPKPQPILFNPRISAEESIAFNLNANRSSIRPMPDSILIFGENKDSEGLYEVEIAESKLKSEVISYMIDFKRTYPQIFLVLDMKVRMEDKAKDYIYKLKTRFAQDATGAIQYCEEQSGKDTLCIVEKETKIVGHFASKEDLFNYRNKLALEGALENKTVYVRRYEEETEREVQNVNMLQSSGKEALIKEYVTYLGGVSYELLIISENLFDESVEKFCAKYKAHLECTSGYIANHGIEKHKIDLRRSSLTRQTVIDAYDMQQEDNVWYRLTTGEFAKEGKAFDFCNSIGITDDKCIVFERELESTLLRKSH